MVNRQRCEWPDPGRCTCTNYARSTVTTRRMGRWRSFVTRRHVCGIHEGRALRDGWKIER